VAEQNGQNGRLRGAQFVLVGCAVVAIAGSSMGLYSSLHGDITTNLEANRDMQRQLDRLSSSIHDWEVREETYDAEVRGRIADQEKEVRELMRAFSERHDKTGP
jgi:hypothetical protein